MDAGALGAGGLGVVALQNMRSLVVFPMAAVPLRGHLHGSDTRKGQ
jgi:hypothetical protein